MTMLDWLRYFPLAFRTSFEPVTPKGPYFSKLRKQCWVLGDNQFHFSAPWSNPIFGAETYSRDVYHFSPGNIDILHKDWGYINSDETTFHRWHHGFFFSREWLFVGPWFTGYASRLILSANIIKTKKHPGFNRASFFHPRVFETVITDYLHSYYGHRRAGQKPRFRGPLNWRLLPISETIQAVCLDIHNIGDTSIEAPELERLVFFPISTDHFIKLEFDFGGTIITNTDVNPQPQFDLTESIINTFKLNVGPDTLAQWEAVHAMCPDMSLTSEFGELKWPIKPEDIGKTEPAPGRSRPAIEKDMEKIQQKP